MDEMEQVAANSPALEGRALTRFLASFDRVKGQALIDERLALEFLSEDWCKVS
jgi:hypothetical protein